MFVFLLALLLIAALHWSCFGVTVSTGPHSSRVLSLEIVTLLRRFSSAVCIDRASDSVIETLQLPPPRRGDEVFVREYALQPAARSHAGCRIATADRVFLKRSLSD